MPPLGVSTIGEEFAGVEQPTFESFIPDAIAEKVVPLRVGDLYGPTLEPRHEVGSQGLEAIAHLADVVEGEKERRPADERLFVQPAHLGEPPE